MFNLPDAIYPKCYMVSESLECQCLYMFLKGFVLKYCIYLFSNIHIINNLGCEKLILGSCTYESLGEILCSGTRGLVHDICELDGVGAPQPNLHPLTIQDPLLLTAHLQPAEAGETSATAAALTSHEPAERDSSCGSALTTRGQLLH